MIPTSAATRIFRIVSGSFGGSGFQKVYEFHPINHSSPDSVFAIEMRCR